MRYIGEDDIDLLLEGPDMQVLFTANGTTGPCIFIDSDVVGMEQPGTGGSQIVNHASALISSVTFPSIGPGDRCSVQFIDSDGNISLIDYEVWRAVKVQDGGLTETELEAV